MLKLKRSVQVLHGSRFYVDEAWRKQLANQGIVEGRQWESAETDSLMSRSDVTRCFRMQLDNGAVVFFKRYVYPPNKWFEFWMRPGKATVEVFSYNKLKDLGIPTLDVLGFGERRLLGMLMSTFIVTKEAISTKELEDFAVNEWYLMPEKQRLAVYKEIADKLVQQIRVAHKARFFHHDLKWRNILIRHDEAGYTPIWIDSPRGNIKRLRWRRGVIVDLSGLARLARDLLSVHQQMRFLCKYLGPERKPGQVKALYLSVLKHLSRRPPRPLKLPPRVEA